MGSFVSQEKQLSPNSLCSLIGELVFLKKHKKKHCSDSSVLAQGINNRSVWNGGFFHESSRQSGPLFQLKV